ncbi:hypothetical protein DSUL_20043 [Desulfovibrionales bacterium]
MILRISHMTSMIVDASLGGLNQCLLRTTAKLSQDQRASSSMHCHSPKRQGLTLRLKINSA